MNGIPPSSRRIDALIIHIWRRADEQLPDVGTVVLAGRLVKQGGGMLA